MDKTYKIIFPEGNWEVNSFPETYTHDDIKYYYETRKIKIEELSRSSWEDLFR